MITGWVRLGTLVVACSLSRHQTVQSATPNVGNGNTMNSQRFPLVALCVAALCAAALASGTQAQQPAVGFRKHTLAIGYQFASVVVADFDRDGNKDVATAATEEVAWFAGGARNILWRKFPIAAQTAE